MKKKIDLGDVDHTSEINPEVSESRTHKCTICGKEAPWGKSWSKYGSILIEEIRPKDMILTCGDACRDILDLKLKTGEITMVDIKPYGMNDYIITGERTGY